MSLGHIADDTYLRPVARSKIATPEAPESCVPTRVGIHQQPGGLVHIQTPGEHGKASKEFAEEGKEMGQG